MDCPWLDFSSRCRWLWLQHALRRLPQVSCVTGLVGDGPLAKQKTKVLYFFILLLHQHSFDWLFKWAREKARLGFVCLRVSCNTLHYPGRIHYLLSIGLLLMLTREAIKDFHLTIPWLLSMTLSITDAHCYCFPAMAYNVMNCTWPIQPN